jgi:peptidoglycan-N-acetylglucosamine deacetylase
MNIFGRTFFVSVIICISIFFVTCSKDPITDPQIALTFDDGPDSIYTPKILDILKEKNVKATFFLIGKHVAAYPKIVARIMNEGHIIGNHSYTHLYMPGASDSLVLNEINRTQHLLDSITGGLPYKIFRAPWGLINEEQKNLIRGNGYTYVSWNSDPKDFDISKNTPAIIVENVLTESTNNSIVLLHSADYNDLESRQNTVDALPVIIDDLRNKYHYKFISVNQLPN